MTKNRIFVGLTSLLILMAWSAASAVDGARIVGTASNHAAHVHSPGCIHIPEGNIARLGGPSKRNILGVKRDKSWRLPAKSLAAVGPRTIRVLVLRYDFLEDTDPLTTGDGKFDFRDTTTFFREERHKIDPAPHYKEYFESHMDALHRYYHSISDSLLTIEYDVFPSRSDSVYHLNQTMTYYGERSPADGLGHFVIDAVELVEANDDEVVFSDYESYILVHAGADRQNDILSNSYHDLYTANVFLNPEFYVSVDDGTHEVKDALILPEATSQDGRIVALNTVAAHEFGHQLGLVDLYNTGTTPFITRIGDFALMDNMGRGTVAQVGFKIYTSETTIDTVFRFVSDLFPVAPMAWSRAFLGFNEPVVFREDSQIDLVAATMYSDGIKIAKIPINEQEYFLLENRQQEIDGIYTDYLIDPENYVNLGTGYIDFDTISYDPLIIDTVNVFTGELDNFAPGSGILIWHVNEAIAARDTVRGGETITFFDANILQILANEPFIELVEADGIQHFGRGYTTLNYVGIQEDMYYSPHNTSFTPASVPPSESFTGANSDIYIDNISSPGVIMTCDLSRDFASSGFPRRGGYPLIGFSPIADDLDGDSDYEIIFASGRNLNVINSDGTNFWTLGDPVYDSVFSSVGSYEAELPLFRRENFLITSPPSTGDFGLGGNKYIAIGAIGFVRVYSIDDDNDDDRPDLLFADTIQEVTVWSGFNDSILTYLGYDSDDGICRLYTYNVNGERPVTFPEILENEPFGVSLVGENYALLAGDSTSVNLYFIDSLGNSTAYDLDGPFFYGPVTADLERDGLSEIIVATPDGHIKIVTIDNTNITPAFSYKERYLDDSITVNPVIADVSNNGYPDIILAGLNRVYALNSDLIFLTDYPATVDRSYQDQTVVAPPVVADIDRDGRQDVIVPASNGNCYALGPHRLHNFPISAGSVNTPKILTYLEEWERRYVNVNATDVGSAVIIPKDDRAGLGFLGADGWFYSYDVWYDSDLADWTMYGGGPDGSLEFSEDNLSEPVAASSDFPSDSLYCYPNPSLDGNTRLRYFVGGRADVSLKVFDLTGVLVYEESFNDDGGSANERQLNLSFLPTGVYRCKVKANVGGTESSNYTDVAIIK